MNPWAIAVIVVAALFVFLSVGIAIMMFRTAARRLVRKTQLKPEEDVFYDYRSIIEAGKAWYETQPVEELWMRSYDGLRLYGRLIRCENAKGSILMMHGYHGEALVDLTTSMRYCHEAGYNLLVPDQRTHGISEGRYITFGVRERRDALGWIAELNERFGAESPVFLYGLSMGCSTVLMASGLSLLANVKGIVADCGYTRPWDICAHVLKTRMRLPVFPILHIVDIICWLLAGFGLRQASVPRALKKNTRPVLFYHGSKDDFVPLWMGNANYANCVAEKEQIIVEDAAHAQCFFVEPERCLAALGAFLEKYGN